MDQMPGRICAPDDPTSLSHQTHKSCPHNTFSHLLPSSHYASAGRKKKLILDFNQRHQKQAKQ